MKFSLSFLLVAVFQACSATTVDEVNKYFNDVRYQISQTVQGIGLSLYKLPNFNLNMQSRSPDGTVVNAKVWYHSGNLTGLDGVASGEKCPGPVWSSGNITAQCEMIVEKIDIKYEARLQNLTGISNNVHFRQKDYGVEGLLTNTHVLIEITSSPHIMVPSLKNFRITKFGELEIYYETTEDAPYEQISSHLHFKLADKIKELFQGAYKDAVRLAVGAVQFPKKV